MKTIIKIIKRAYCRWQFKRLAPVDREVMRYLRIDPQSLIDRGKL